MPQLSPMNWIFLSAIPMLIMKTLILTLQPSIMVPHKTNNKMKISFYTWTW